MVGARPGSALQEGGGGSIATKICHIACVPGGVLRNIRHSVPRAARMPGYAALGARGRRLVDGMFTKADRQLKTDARLKAAKEKATRDAEKAKEKAKEKVAKAKQKVAKEKAAEKAAQKAAKEGRRAAKPPAKRGVQRSIAKQKAAKEGV